MTVKLSWLEFSIATGSQTTGWPEPHWRISVCLRNCAARTHSRISFSPWQCGMKLTSIQDHYERKSCKRGTGKLWLTKDPRPPAIIICQTPPGTLSIHFYRLRIIDMPCSFRKRWSTWKNSSPRQKARKTLFSMLEILVQKQQDTLGRLRAETKHHTDKNVIQALKEEYAELQKQLGITIAEMQSLRIPLGKRLLHIFTSLLESMGKWIRCVLACCTLACILFLDR